MMAEKLELGDYVLATKYSDGDPQDQWAIGFYAGVTAPHYNPRRFDVVDNEGRNVRGNGFRRVEKISRERGEWILRHAKEIEQSGLSMWNFATCPMTPNAELTMHWSDCALHNAPAFEPGPCDCGALMLNSKLADKA